MKTRRVLIVEDHAIVRQGLAALLAEDKTLAVCGLCGTGHEALAALALHEPDLVLLDLSLPDIPGLELARMMKERLPALKILVLTMHSSATHIKAAARAGVDGYVVKGSDLSVLQQSLRRVLDGERLLVGTLPEGEGKALSGREEEILRLVALGKTSAEVGIMLSISTKTVENHRSRIMDKLDTHDLAGLVRQAIRLGLVGPE